jgi:hypothetical protein
LSAAGTRRASARRQRERELGGGNRVAGGCGEHGDPALRGCVDINGVHADACAADDLQPSGARERLARDLSGAAHEHCVGIRDGVRQLRTLEARLYDQLEAGVVA